MGVFLFIIGLLGIGFFIGYRIGSRFIREQNLALLQQISLLQSYSTHWAHEATGKYTLVGQVSDISAGNLSATMQAVIHILNTMQVQQGNNLSSQEQEKVSALLQQARSIASPQ